MFIIGSTRPIAYRQLMNIDQFFELIWESSPGNNLLTTKWVTFFSYIITRNSVIVLFTEEGPQFHIF